MPRKEIREITSELRSWLPNYCKGPTTIRASCFASSPAFLAVTISRTLATSLGTGARAAALVERPSAAAAAPPALGRCKRRTDSHAPCAYG